MGAEGRLRVPSRRGRPAQPRLAGRLAGRIPRGPGRGSGPGGPLYRPGLGDTYGRTRQTCLARAVPGLLRAAGGRGPGDRQGGRTQPHRPRAVAHRPDPRPGQPGPARCLLRILGAGPGTRPAPLRMPCLGPSVPVREVVGFARGDVRLRRERGRYGSARFETACAAAVRGAGVRGRVPHPRHTRRSRPVRAPRRGGRRPRTGPLGRVRTGQPRGGRLPQPPGPDAAAYGALGRSAGRVPQYRRPCHQVPLGVLRRRPAPGVPGDPLGRPYPRGDTNPVLRPPAAAPYPPPPPPSGRPALRARSR
ncbi:hypothetical protein GA0115254_1166141 [Streptomyces sp. Ncost-T10-10d]|nr:hypothetical protein GA0115254_1166141 [Streptomyces sp. Ncost-T10-10d]